MSGFFSPDNWYWKPFAYVGDAVILSGMWLLGTIPLITAGAATTALYDTVAHCVRGRERDMLSRFWGTFKREIVPSFLSLVLWVLVITGLYKLIGLYAGTLENTNFSVMIVAALLFALSVVVGIFSWVLPLLSRFTFSLGALNLTAVKLACGHPFRTILSGLFTMGAAALCLRTGFAFLLVPEILAVLWAFLMEPVFKKYMTEEERQAVEKCKDDKEDPL